MGDLRRKYLIVIELMGKHSNIIFCDENDMILDSIKHISAQVSSVREVLPGRDLFYPPLRGEEKSAVRSRRTEFKELLITGHTAESFQSPLHGSYRLKSRGRR